MTLNLIKTVQKKFLSKNEGLNYLILTRCSHQNHPGHKPRRKAFTVKDELPDVYSEDCLYPPIKPKYPAGFNWKENTLPSLAWHYYNEGANFHKLKTIQERLSILAYLNIQPTMEEVGFTRMRHYPLFLLNALPRAAKSKNFYQYITKTELDAESKIPAVARGGVDVESYEKIKEAIVNCVLTNLIDRKKHHDNLWDVYNDKEAYKPDQIEFEKILKGNTERNDLLINDILTSIVTILSTSDQNLHLTNAYYGRHVDIQGYWKRCGFKESRPRGAVSPDEDVIRFQFRDKALLQIKCEMPIKPIKKFNELNNNDKAVPVCAYQPAFYSIFADHTLPMQVPGSWYGDSREFNFLTVFNSTNLYQTERKYGMDEVWPALQSMAMQAGHAETTAQAYYLGYSMWKDLTYPLLTRLLFSNGQDFCFAKYQLNSLHSWNPGEPKNNLCYISKPEKLFELNEDRTQVSKINESVLDRLLEILTEKPIQNPNEIVDNYSELEHMIGGTPLRPYLSIQNFEQQLSMRRKLLALTLYELVKYDKPVTYLDIHTTNKAKGERPRFPHSYNRITYAFKDIVRDYYPKEYHGYQLVKLSLKKSEWYKPKIWDLKNPVYEWASVPPPHTNNIKRDIKLPTF